MFVQFARRPSLTLVGAVALVLALANPAAAPPGDLDPTFDGDGKVTTDFAGGNDQGFGVALQGDGKIVATGIADISGNPDFAVARYNTDASLDATFDGDGKVNTDFAGDLDYAQAVAVQGDGKIVAAGVAFVSTFDFGVARYNTDGSLDTTFGTGGKVTTDFAGGSGDAAGGVAIQADGKIVAAGSSDVSGTLDFALARYNTDGSLDTTFGTGGKVTTDFAGGFDQPFSVALQGDGKILAAGFAEPPGTFDFALTRYNTDGSLDTTFDGNGKVTTDFAGDWAIGLALQGDGKILAGGFGVLARYNADGSLDPTFGGDGNVTTDFAAEGVAVQGNGKIVTAGSAFVSGSNDFGVARYNTDGPLDTTFSGDGKVTTDFAGGDDVAWGVAIQANGRIVAAGQADVAGNLDFALARYTCVRRTSRPTSIPFCP